LAFLLVPLIEIALFIQIGGLLGLWTTLAIVILTAVLGAAMVRSQGLATLEKLRRSLSDLGDPTEPLAHGAMILFSGALLLTPGFFTDTLGFLLLVPGVRSAVFRHIRSRIRIVETGSRPHAPAPSPEDDVIDADFVDLDTPNRPTHRPSGWTRH
jgi:UPF0716 protein FxsA